MMRNSSKRSFFILIIVIGVAVCLSGFSLFNKQTTPESSESEIKFITPVDGDMLNEYDGTVNNETLIIKVKISAPAGSRINVNGIKAKFIDNVFQDDISLKQYENTIKLIEGEKGYEENIKVFWLKNYANKFRLSIDDNILFLKDINLNADKYKSIFDNPYLGFLKKVHETYGARIHLNLFYETEGFNLSQMTAKFKPEWKANSEWLALSFHSLAEFPGRPYINAGYDQVYKDCNLVMEQIRRFAGEEVLGPETTLHFGEGTTEGCRALKDQGYTILAGYFNVDDNLSPVSYYLTEEQRRHLKSRFIWKDNKEGIIFSRIAIVINTVTLDQILPNLDNVKKTYNPRYIDLMIHEQYFYKDYVNYQPDFREKVMASVKWAVDNGYTPGFLKESVFN
jgi:hypothetical protein